MEIDADLVRRLLAEQFPEWAGLPVTPVLPGGWDNRTFRVGHDLSVRLPSRGRYAAQVEKEHVWLPRLAPHLPLAIPKSLALGAPGQGYRHPWSVRGWITGAPLGPEDATPQIARQLAAFLRALQAVPVGDGPWFGEHNHQRGGPLATYDDQVRWSLKALRGQIDADLAAALWQAACNASWAGPGGWLHGDVVPTNLLRDPGGLCAVIDFGLAGVGDPACDYAIAWTFFGEEARAAFREVLKVDDDSWARGQAWALWKALIEVAGYPGTDPAKAPAARRVLTEILGR